MVSDKILSCFCSMFFRITSQSLCIDTGKHIASNHIVLVKNENSHFRRVGFQEALNIRNPPLFSLPCKSSITSVLKWEYVSLCVKDEVGGIPLTWNIQGKFSFGSKLEKKALSTIGREVQKFFRTHCATGRMSSGEKNTFHLS